MHLNISHALVTSTEKRREEEIKKADNTVDNTEKQK